MSLRWRRIRRVYDALTRPVDRAALRMLRCHRATRKWMNRKEPIDV